MHKLLSAIFQRFNIDSVASAQVDPEAVPGLVTLKSNHSVAQTADKLEAILKEKGMTIFTRINHSEVAANVGHDLRDTELVIFGNPQAATAFMQSAQHVAIDLPMKALIWKDEQGDVWYSYNEPFYVAQRHNMQSHQEVVQKVSDALANFAKAATSAE